MRQRAMIAATGALLVVLAGAGPGAAATGDDPDWPCIQRLLPEIAAGMVWPGPPLGEVEAEAGPEPARLAEELAARRVPLEDARAMVEAYAQRLEPAEREEALTRLFASTLEVINRERASIIQGIRKFARGQRQLAERIAERNAEMRRLASDAVMERQELLLERDWDARLFDDRQDSLAYLCEQPVLLEQRAFALGRTMAGLLE